MASELALINYATSEIIYLHGSGSITEYTGTGTPWDDPATTPFQLAMNDVTGQRWTPQEAPLLAVFAGGPPFRDGQSLVMLARGNAQETIPIQAKANSHDNAVELLRIVRQLLNSIIALQPPALSFKPDGASTAGLCYVYTAQLQETPHFINEEAGQWKVRANITLTRTPYWTLEPVEAFAGPATFTNTGTGANPNTTAYDALVGDAIHAGQPLSIFLSGGVLANTTAKKIYMASVRSRQYTSRGDAISTTSASGVAVGSTTSFTTSNASIHTALRFIGRVASPNVALEMRVVVTTAAANGTTVFTSEWIAPGTANAYVDFGSWEPPPELKLAAFAGTLKVYVQPQARSSTGGSATGTLSYLEILDYYEFCQLSSSTVPSSSRFQAVAYDNHAGASQPMYPAVFQALNTSNEPIQSLDVSGTMPKAHEGASLYLAWVDNNTHTTSDTISVSANYLPLYLTLKGGG